MKKLKQILYAIFIDGLSGMAMGLFATLIIGTIICQIGSLVGSNTIGSFITYIGKMTQAITGAGIGVGVASKLKKPGLVVFSSAVAGMVGAFASKIIAGTFLVEGIVNLAGPGEPLGAFIAAYFGMWLGGLVAGKTKVDILVVPFVTIISGSTLGLLVGPPISGFMTWLGSIINWGTEQQPLLMGIIVSVIMGVVLTLPISSAALGIILNLSGLAAGAATIGCCCNMIGFAVISYRENKVGGLIAQGLGTSMLQVPNLMKKPILWLPPVITSAILGPVSTCIFHMTNNATGSGMGSAGLVGQLMTWQDMSGTKDPWILLFEIILMQFLFPAAISFGISEVMRRKGLIQPGDLKLDL